MPVRSGDPPRFILDSMLGRLARYLRFLGFDTAYERGIPDAFLLARAQGEGRILLSRDAGIFETRRVASGDVPALMLVSSNTLAQLRQVSEHFDLGGWASRLRTRCVECNSPLEEIDRREARHLVPPFVLATQVEISYCPCDHHAVWQGSHWENLKSKLEKSPAWLTDGESGPGVVT